MMAYAVDGQSMCAGVSILARTEEGSVKIVSAPLRVRARTWWTTPPEREYGKILRT